ncbi:prostaglandin E2 receptor EP4 subtype-like isoform X1 [Patiria miniata]|uniref:G-protein coupled receptors family 1 profile domain-containing protein n=1 Tax=Patiria miniata TaxID=46514 RepID=A0A914B362_PATMI|nr:prostaglandin E2 receptor EP4 subtype-like isoform X1 [Patiria miniata]XP_038070244.1 prostaglandin E2 receptor EP4 subtype-like isoform X1 [Patiria miniata]XP_038070245.1 prostaglandin E2 receptor EP4 subtype-like isoform X1 [Patiria miniata]
MVEVNTPQTGVMMGNSDNMTSMIALTPSVTVMTPITMMGTGLFGNIIALGVYHCSCPAHRNLPFYGLMKGLLWTNVVGYLAVYPLIVAAYFNGLRWIGGLHTCNFQGLSTLSFGMSTSLLVGCMGFERFLAVCKPALHAKRVERRKIPYLIFLVWVFAVFTAFMPIVGFGEMVQHYPGTWCFVNWRHQQTVGKLYTSILAAELSGILLLVFSCLLSVVGYSIMKLLRLVPKQSEGGVVEVTGTTIRRLSVRRTRRSSVVPGSASPWLTFHYVMFASSVLICVAPVVMRIILNVAGFEEDHFATFRAMGFAECFPASAPWIYMLLHQRLWQRFLPCCFSKHLPNIDGRYVNYHCHPPEQARNHNHVGSEAGDNGAGETRGANNNLQPNNLEGSTGYKTVTEDGSTMEILTIRNVARKNQQQRSKTGQAVKLQSWKPLIESPNSNPSSNSKLAVYNHPMRGQVTDGPTYHLTDHMHMNHHCSDGSMTRVEYHALMRMMDEDSRENVSIDDHAELAKACTFGKESTI